MSAINADVDSAVKSLFSIKDYYVTDDGAAEYKVVYEESSGGNFLKLLEALAKVDYSAQLYGDREQATLVVLKNPPPPPREGRTRLSGTAFLFLLTLLSVLVTAYVVAIVFPRVSPNSSPIAEGAGFVLALIGLFGLRYLAQRFAARRGRFSSLSYYLPNVPIFIPLATMYFLPTFGAVSFPGTPPANKNKLFDFYLLGSLAIVVVALVVALLGAGTSVSLTQSQIAALSTGNQTTTIQTNPSLLQSGVLSFSQSVGLIPSLTSNTTLFYSPVEIAAWIAFLLAFFNLLPAALFDGGRMARLALGERGSRATTALSGLLLLLLDTPDYLVVFLLVFLMAAFPVQGETLDSISGLSRGRKAALAVAVLVGFLCVPVPQTFLFFRL